MLITLLIDLQLYKFSHLQYCQIPNKLVTVKHCQLQNRYLTDSCHVNWGKNMVGAATPFRPAVENVLQNTGSSPNLLNKRFRQPNLTTILNPRQLGQTPVASQ